MCTNVDLWVHKISTSWRCQFRFSMLIRIWKNVLLFPSVRDGFSGGEISAKFQLKRIRIQPASKYGCIGCCSQRRKIRPILNRKWCLTLSRTTTYIKAKSASIAQRTAKTLDKKLNIDFHHCNGIHTSYQFETLLHAPLTLGKKRLTT